MNKTAQRGDEATVTNGDIKADQNKLEIIQKSLARSLVRCRNTQSKRIGVELLEASVYDLNPHNMRKTYQLGSYRYDPGKYRSMTKEPGEAMLTRRATVGGGSRIVKDRNQEEKDYVKETKGGGGDATNAGVKEVDGHVVEKEEHSSHKSKLKRVATVISADDDEIDAPWNQYAWIEEMQIRVSLVYCRYITITTHLKNYDCAHFKCLLRFLRKLVINTCRSYHFGIHFR